MTRDLSREGRAGEELNQEAERARRWVDADWLVSQGSSRLHYAMLSDEEAVELEGEARAEGDPVIRLACGRGVGSVSIPGMFSRMGVERCQQCCRAVGCPPGVGSPKNDSKCTMWLVRMSEERVGRDG